jgi:hypothetical protein
VKTTYEIVAETVHRITFHTRLGTRTAIPVFRMGSSQRTPTSGRGSSKL